MLRDLRRHLKNFRTEDPCTVHGSVHMHRIRRARRKPNTPSTVWSSSSPAAACTSRQGLCESQTHPLPCGLVLLELSCRSGAARPLRGAPIRARLLRSQTAAAKLCLDRRCAERSRTLPVPVRADWSSAPAGAEHERQTTRYERVTAAGSEAFDLCASAGKLLARAG